MGNIQRDTTRMFNKKHKMFYRRHIFFCTNKNEDGTKCCQDNDALSFKNYAKAKCQELKIHEPGEIRVNTAGCLNRCLEGPVAVVYPEGVWYTYKNLEDIDEIIAKHLVDGQIVQRLKI